MSWKDSMGLVRRASPGPDGRQSSGDEGGTLQSPRAQGKHRTHVAQPDTRPSANGRRSDLPEPPRPSKHWLRNRRPQAYAGGELAGDASATAPPPGHRNASERTLLGMDLVGEAATGLILRGSGGDLSVEQDLHRPTRP